MMNPKTYQFDPREFALLERSCIPLAVYQFIDRRVVTLALSEGFCRLFGYERALAYQLMDNDMYRDTHRDDVARIADAAYRFATEGGLYNVVYRTRVGSGYTVIHAYGEHILTETGERLAVVWYNNEGSYVEDAGEPNPDLLTLLNRRLHSESFVQANYYDRMTGLPNMGYFLQLAEAGHQRMLEDGKNPVMLFFDLTGMKYYNRTHGFDEGDKLICGLGKLLVRYFSNENCSHFGQDHFAAFTDDVLLEERLEALLAEAATLNGGKSLPLRVGIYPNSLGTVSASIACDRAKYACDQSRGSYVSDYYSFDEKMLAQVENHRYIVNNIDRALREGWIKVYYQPIVRTANGRVCDEEALSRWLDPVKGLLMPKDFIPVLENAGLIYKLDLYVLEQILNKLKNQKAAGLYTVPQSLNLSRSDYEACDIVEEVRRRVDEAGIPREMITIEVTESLVGSDFEFMKDRILRFRELGFRVWIDDFGSGYSSLDVLQNVPFDLIKFDMHFMQQFDQNDDSRIILTELMRMAIALGRDTVVEGVETQEQVDFLREIGCTKLQGYYFCRPIPMEEILKRYEEGRQIGFENPAEAEYFSAIGRLNLYDLSAVASSDSPELSRYFDTLPVAIVEADEKYYWVTRCNRSYRVFMTRTFGHDVHGQHINRVEFKSRPGSPFARALEQCREAGKRVYFEEELEDGSVIHAGVRHVATNPVTGIAACAVVMLGITDVSDRGLTYTHIAQALSSDYMYLYHVNMDTERFVEYSSAPAKDNLFLERRGSDFFAASRRDALHLLYEMDQDAFIRAFTKENVMQAIAEHGAFTVNYRLLVNGVPTYMSMKAVRVREGDNHIIIGVSNVDAQMKQQETLERMREERITYDRISALSGDYICIYTVDPETDRYSEYYAAQDYLRLGLPKEGEDFFRESLRKSAETVFAGDLRLFQSEFSKEKVMQAIRDNGIYGLRYRLMIHGEPIHVSLKAALVEERDGPKIIVGINNIDGRIRRDQRQKR